jgi:hypothetical protein
MATQIVPPVNTTLKRPLTSIDQQVKCRIGDKGVVDVNSCQYSVQPTNEQPLRYCGFVEVTAAALALNSPIANGGPCANPYDGFSKAQLPVKINLI